MLVLPVQNEQEIQLELKKIGVDESAWKIMSPKSIFRVLKIEGLSMPAANILKQEMLARGGDVAVARGVINASVESTDALIFGTQKQFSQLIEKISLHQFGLPQLAEGIKKTMHSFNINAKAMRIGRHDFKFGQRTFIMGVLNITPDSFSDGGHYLNTDAAIKHALEMAENGADIIDVGGESNRPGSESVSEDEEIKRVIPVIKGLKKNTDKPISIDTRKAKVAHMALQAGADMINDISAMQSDKDMQKIAAAARVPVCIMHMQGTPKDMQKDPHYSDLTSEIAHFFFARIAKLKEAGIAEDNIILDPGIGFGKKLEHNIEIIKKLRAFRSLGRPLLVGTSRKSMIGEILSLPPDDRLEGTAATVAVCIINGADIVRVHDVKEIYRVAKTTDAIAREKTS